MLVDLFRRIQFAPVESYQYVGLGSVAFIDFRMVHMALGINDLVSIEGTDDPEERVRFTNNNPYAGLTLKFGLASAVLPTIDFSRRTLVWLDYDGALARSMANDIATVARSAASGTFIGVTFTTAFPVTPKDREKELTRLKDDFSDFLPEGTPAQAFDGGKYAEFGRATLGTLLERAISDADAGEKDPQARRTAFQVCYFRYKDGVPMVTVGWFIVSGADLEQYIACRFEDLPFVKTGVDAFRIRVPLVTPLEVREMERRLPALGAAADLAWIPAEERTAFLNVYRYLPHFAAVEQV